MGVSSCLFSVDDFCRLPPDHATSKQVIDQKTIRKSYQINSLALLEHYDTPPSELSPAKRRGVETWKNTALVVISLAVLCIFTPSLATVLAKGVSVLFGGFCFLLSPILVPLVPILILSPSAQLAISIGILVLGIFTSSDFTSGITMGFSGFTNALPLLIAIRIISNIALSTIRKDETSIPDTYAPQIKASPFTTCIIAPVVEEIFFRIVLPYAVEYGMKAFYQITNHSELSENQKATIQKVKVVIPSIAFGLAHFCNPHPFRLFQTLYTGMIAAGIFDRLKEDFGFVANTSYHMANNTLASILIKLSK